MDELPGLWNEALWQLALRARRGQFTTNGGLGKLDEDLVAEASIRTGGRLTEKQVHRALQAGKKKVIESAFRSTKSWRAAAQSSSDGRILRNRCLPWAVTRVSPTSSTSRFFKRRR